MSTDPVCVYCGAPLEDDVYRCDRCGNKNANFGRPESLGRVIPYSMKLIGRGADGFNLSKAAKPQIQTEKKQAPPVRQQSAVLPVQRPRISPPPQPVGNTLFSASATPGRVIIILTCIVAILFLIIASSKKMVAYGYFGAGQVGTGAGFQLMLLFFGPLSAYWALKSFVPKSSRFRKLMPVFWFAMQVLHFALFGINNP
jgi:DNA-directed RNA polymerase subunit RPC12/RpoP